MRRRGILLLALSALWMGALLTGLVRGDLRLVAISAVFFFAETLFWKWKFVQLGVRSQITRLLNLYAKADASSERALIREIQLELSKQSQDVDSKSKHHWESLLALVEFRRLHLQKPTSVKAQIQELFILRTKPEKSEIRVEQLSQSEIAEASAHVASLFWKVLNAARDTNSRVSKPARKLLEIASGRPFEQAQTESWVETLTDSVQRNGGISFLLLNLIKRGDWELAKPLGQKLLTSDLPIEEESRACLYWLSELHWFTHQNIAITDFESTIRYLYHLCFTNPERAGFLEIDSQFFSQFENVNELAKEGFLFKEELIERVFVLWTEQNQFFDDVFKNSLQVLTRQRNKIYQDRLTWHQWWVREKDGFEAEYLFLVEGNLFYSRRDFKEAGEFYAKALQCDPHLRPALLNSLFALAQQRKEKEHGRLVEEILSLKSLAPHSLSVIGNSFLLLDRDEEAQKFYDELRAFEGWGKKVDYYQATFCFENGLFEKALRFAKKAHEINPQDMSVSFHLSQCLNAVGEKNAALEILKKIGHAGPQWLRYYQFTLERDAGRLGDAYQTLLQIPTEYFDDPDELEAALDFAKHSSDLNLLRRLKARQ